ncbi:MAG TPA: LysE family translocator [Steroidobacteraceae bacterium]|nr:LysE family translocator [Steroidobacteraceae bacterium]
MSHEALIGVAAVVAAGAITPGPNNAAVMSATMRDGVAGAVAAIIGVIAGSLALLLLAWAGVGALAARHPSVSTAIGIAGCAYLAYVGIRMLLAGVADARPAGASGAFGLPAGFAGLFTFQLLNPKAWTLTLAAIAAAEADGRSMAALSQLAVLFIAIPAICLAAWSLLGAALTKLLADRRRRSPFDRAMGILLIASAALLLREVVHA